jgi:hypothetical protein
MLIKQQIWAQKPTLEVKATNYSFKMESIRKIQSILLNNIYMFGV